MEGVLITPLRQFDDERGAVLHMIKVDSPSFKQFGEVYFSLVNPGHVKAWKRHHKMTQNFAVPVGTIKLVLYDSRENSPSYGKVEVLSVGRPENYALITIPPMICYGFQGVSEEPALITNCADLPHDPEESERIDPDSSAIPYSWN